MQAGIRPFYDRLIPENSVTDIQDALVAELQKLDLTVTEARIFLFLLTHGGSTANEIYQHTGIHRTDTYHHISNLLAKGIVLSTFDRPQKYHALSFNEAIESLIQSKQNALRLVSKKKDEYQYMINRIMETVVPSKNTSNKKDCYQVVVGEDAVNAKVKGILVNAKEEVMLLMATKSLVSFYHAEITDTLTQLALRGIQVTLKTSCKNALDYLAYNEKDMPVGIDYQSVSIRIIASALPLSFILIDNREMILLLENENISLKKSEPGFYTNSSSMTKVFKFIFDSII